MRERLTSLLLGAIIAAGASACGGASAQKQTQTTAPLEDPESGDQSSTWANDADSPAPAAADDDGAAAGDGDTAGDADMAGDDDMSGDDMSGDDGAGDDGDWDDSDDDDGGDSADDDWLQDA